MKTFKYKDLYEQYLKDGYKQITYQAFRNKVDKKGKDYTKWKRKRKEKFSFEQYKTMGRKYNLEQIIEDYKQLGPTETAIKHKTSNQLVHYYYNTYMTKQKEYENL